MLAYVRSSPSESFVVQQYEEVKKKLDWIERGFDVWKKNTPGYVTMANPLASWRNMNNFSELSNQLRNLEYILGI